jgi:tetratricopeptide (TPR) repeat protein
MKSRVIALLLALMAVGHMGAQYNVDRLITSGEVALHYEDYVLSIQYFNKVLALKPYLWLPWYDRAVAKFYLDDFVGAEADASKAIELNPYIEQIFDLRAISSIRQEKYAQAIADYDKAYASIRRVELLAQQSICRMNVKDYDQACSMPTRSSSAGPRCPLPTRSRPRSIWRRKTRCRPTTG